ncbi:hypothetical protein [Rathayibacter toxicus]|uniref:Uncharacterized protein n=1 Tax=Rathayibacter toxicus TaxID=145458 RepID=A0A2S5Y4M1_9MICO|nr:hypothetical protein [Rathayibacter toxicus]PPH21214.1 hypothetical protein C5D17_10310 [Rathayibacter toxicus]PPH56329.1 hypothetical protein C5D30_10295 [Rathayibacter toxicus]PPH58425.1 hypothetical protein C5C93_10355 [Rathayibacter toxicus]PPH86170.1 hypothetical protein C5D31_10330 [Rathayibacter toxicus]PPI13502.1 hypothetical protein C5C51_10285 [Rathayibacter toxicus]
MAVALVPSAAGGVSANAAERAKPETITATLTVRQLSPDQQRLADQVTTLIAGADQRTAAFDTRSVDQNALHSEVGEKFTARFAEDRGTVVA